MSDLLEIEEIMENWNKVIDKVNQSAKKAGRNPADIKVMAVTKTHPEELIRRACEAGILTFGENYAQELRDKEDYFRNRTNYDIEWHFIGHLQRNKVKYLAPFVKMIHSVDSPRLAKQISKEAKKNERNIDILLQVNTSGEESKFGYDPDNVLELAGKALQYDNITVRGLMTIGSFEDNEEINRREFSLLRSLRDKCAKEFPEADFSQLSMGMTHDYPLAVEEGSTFVRIGTAIFGPRNYDK